MEKLRKNAQKFILITLLKLITVDEMGVDEMGVDEMGSRRSENKHSLNERKNIIPISHVNH